MKRQFWARVRFEVPGDDPRPMTVPAPGPWWYSGEGNGTCIVVAYIPLGRSPYEGKANDVVLRKRYWPDARDICDCGEQTAPVWSDRFGPVEGWSIAKQEWLKEYVMKCAQQMLALKAKVAS